ncbi:MAG: hypothetical protein PVJ89_02900 [Planctomycetota bacterium]|jgi:hypothetical protein
MEEGVPIRRRAALGAALLAWALAACAGTRAVEEVLETDRADPIAPAPSAPASSAAAPQRASAAPESTAQPPSSSAGTAAPTAPSPTAASADRAALVEHARRELQRSKVECTALLERARAEDASYELLMATSRALILNADLRLQSALALDTDPADLPPPPDLIDLEDEVSSELKAEIRSLATSSAAFADRALALRPGDPAAELFSTLGTGLRLWSMPTLQALASGAATTLPGRIKTLAANAPELEGASPLRLKGRFQSRAPWPFKDLEEGEATLTAAVEVAPIPLNLLFLGDALWLRGEEEDARERWSEAVRAEADAETLAAAPLIREIARLRLVSAGVRTAR